MAASSMAVGAPIGRSGAVGVRRRPFAGVSPASATCRILPGQRPRFVLMRPAASAPYHAVSTVPAATTGTSDGTHLQSAIISRARLVPPSRRGRPTNQHLPPSAEWFLRLRYRDTVSTDAQALLREVMSLPDEDRADIAAELLASLEDTAVEDPAVARAVDSGDRAADNRFLAG